jgi:hypothetical protein
LTYTVSPLGFDPNVYFDGFTDDVWRMLDGRRRRPAGSLPTARRLIAFVQDSVFGGCPVGVAVGRTGGLEPPPLPPPPQAATTTEAAARASAHAPVPAIADVEGRERFT